MTDKKSEVQPAAPSEDEGISFAAEVWGKLSRVDVGGHIETAEVKNKENKVMYTYQYLGWAWCWSILMKNYPDSTLEILPEDYHADGSVMSNVRVTVIDMDGDSLAKTMWLPVMDARNNSVINPTSRMISDTRMRCLVKCLAMGFGLGLDLWTGSDYPVGVEDDSIDAAQTELLKGMFDRLDEDAQKAFLIWMEVEQVSEIPVLKYQSARKQLERKLKAQSQVKAGGTG